MSGVVLSLRLPFIISIPRHTAYRRISFFILFFVFCQSAFAQQSDSLRLPQETHLKNIRQLTFGVENAEAYLSWDERHLIFQSTRGSLQCDQMFIMDIDGGNQHMVSTGKGKTTCGYFLPGDTSFLYASTHEQQPECPPRPDYSKGYVWAVLHTFDIYLAKLDGTIIKNLTHSDGYDAEATISPLGDRMVFTSDRDGDLELYSMKLDGTDIQRLTHEIGYDGGAFYSPDGKSIVYRCYHPKDSGEVREYQDFLSQNLVKPTKMEIWLMDADGSHKRQVTHLNAASFAPYFEPDGKHIIFASNAKDPQGRNFDLFTVNLDGSGMEQITFNETFDGFPMFTRDGKKLIFASNRHDAHPGETNIFISDWIP